MPEALRTIALEVLPEAEDLQELCEAIVTRVSQHDVPESPDFVRIMSLHKSKGLTSPVVYLVGMVDGVVPTVKASADETEVEEAICEQRRLVYVAITRAAEELVISSSRRMEIATAMGLGVKVVRQQIRKVGQDVVAPTIASPYFAEMVASAPAAVRGTDWLRDVL